MIEDAFILGAAFILMLSGFIIMLFLWLGSLADMPYNVRCPRCRNKQRDSSYRKQVCDKCRKEWFEAYDD
jgi:hypothetical protein